MVIPELNGNFSLSDFRSMVWDYYSENGRKFPWRETRDHYSVFLSEIMLQQTQTARVLPKYEAFLEQFPDFFSLSQTHLPEVLALWTGLGYNRRAKFLLESARIIVSDYSGLLPLEYNELLQLPGIGPNTAGSLTAFAHNLPIVFIETNIRRVFLHYYYPDVSDVSDKQLLPLIEASLDKENPREWYYALMDLGAAMKMMPDNPNRRSRHYIKQAPFENSQRQLRGRILRLLQREGVSTIRIAAEQTGFPLYRVEAAAEALTAEGFIVAENEHIRLNET
ncbi:HhH-GPD family protein [Spirochaeta dissipatitropha]